jgi:hypothetical protein
VAASDCGALPGGLVPAPRGKGPGTPAGRPGGQDVPQRASQGKRSAGAAGTRNRPAARGKICGRPQRAQREAGCGHRRSGATWPSRKGQSRSPDTSAADLGHRSRRETPTRSRNVLEPSREGKHLGGRRHVTRIALLPRPVATVRPLRGRSHWLAWCRTTARGQGGRSGIRGRPPRLLVRRWRTWLLRPSLRRQWRRWLPDRRRFRPR